MPDDFHLIDERHAWWAMRRLVTCRIAMSAVEAQAAGEIAAIRQWADDVTAADRDEADRMERLLAEYLRREREASGGKVKTIRTPWGDITSRGPGQGKVEVADEAAAVAALRECAPELVKSVTVESVKVAELKKSLELDGTQYRLPMDPNPETGEIPHLAGVVFVPGEIKYDVKPDLDAVLARPVGPLTLGGPTTTDTEESQP